MGSSGGAKPAAVGATGEPQDQAALLSAPHRHQALESILAGLPLPVNAERISAGQRMLLSRDAPHRSNLLGYSPTSSLMPLPLSFADTVKHMERPTRIFYFFGKPFSLISANAPELLSMEAEFLWRSLYYNICDHLSYPRHFITSELPTNMFSEPLYEFALFFFQCDRLWVFETDCEKFSGLILKYKVRQEGVLVSSQRSKYHTASFTPLRDHERSKPRYKFILTDKSIEVDIFTVYRISDIARQTSEGIALSFQDLGLQESGSTTAKGYCAISWRSPDIEITILSDSDSYHMMDRLSEERLAHLLNICATGVLERLTLIRESEILRSDVRHSIGQEHDKTIVWLTVLQDAWHVLARHLPTRNQGVLESIANLVRQFYFERKRIEDFGIPAYDHWGRKKAVVRRAASFSVLGHSLEEFQEVNLNRLLQNEIDVRGKDSKTKIILQAGLQVSIRTDELAFRACISELLTNADKYLTGNPEIILSILTLEDGSVMIAVENFGPRLTHREQGLVMEYGYRGAYAIRSGKPGSGGGLSLVRDTARDLGLRFDYNASAMGSDGRAGSTAVHRATLTIPVRGIVKKKKKDETEDDDPNTTLGSDIR